MLIANGVANWIKILIGCLLCSQLTAKSLVTQPDKLTPPALPKISIVIDDLGNNSIIGKKIAQLPATLTLSILPHTPHAHTISALGMENGHEIIMHLPMESHTRPELLGKGALFSAMQQAEFEEMILKDAATIPNIIGFNNHMGSLLTQNTEKMNWLMGVALKQNWFFLDSKTSRTSIAQQTASNLGLPSVSRDIFLDHHTEKQHLEKILKRQLKRSLKIADQRGYVVIICHPYPQTYEFLLEQIPQLLENYHLVGISQLVN